MRDGVLARTQRRTRCGSGGSGRIPVDVDADAGRRGGYLVVIHAADRWRLGLWNDIQRGLQLTGMRQTWRLAWKVSREALYMGKAVLMRTDGLVEANRVRRRLELNGVEASVQQSGS